MTSNPHATYVKGFRGNTMGWVITLAGGLTSKAMGARNVDPTLTRYTEAVVKVALRIALIIAILGVMGVETTSFAALLAAAGIAIGAAWSGLLANFAAGAFLMVLRPFKVGDMITAGGVTGDVLEIGVFATTLQTGDNVRVYVKVGSSGSMATLSGLTASRATYGR